MDPPASAPAAEPQGAAHQENPAIWGPVATFLWSLLIAIMFLAAQLFTMFLYVLATMDDPADRTEAALRNLPFDGILLAFCAFASLLVCVPVILGIAKLKRGSELKDYLGLKWPALKQVLRWSLITLGICLLADGISLLLWRPLVPEFMLKSYGSASPKWFLWLALVIAAPVFEEICFRGFIFRGLAASRLRWQGATVITAALWAGIHLQYDGYLMSVVFGLGLLLGTARAMTNSTLLTIWLHSLINILATAQTAFMLMRDG